MEVFSDHEDTKPKDITDDNGFANSSGLMKEISIEILQDKHILKEFFLKFKYKASIEEFYKRYLEMGGESNLKRWQDGLLKKEKLNLLFHSLNSVTMSDLMIRESKILGNIHYYKSYLKIFENLQARNFDHLQLLRHNYLMAFWKKNANDTDSITEKKKKFNECLVEYISNTNYSQDSQLTHLLTLVTSMIAQCSMHDIDSTRILLILDNLVLNLKRDHFVCQCKPFHIATALEGSLMIVIDLLTSKLLSAQQYPNEVKGEIIHKLIHILKYFKSMKILLMILDILKRFSYLTIPMDLNETLDSLAYSIFCYPNSLLDILSCKLSSVVNSVELDLQAIVNSYKISSSPCKVADDKKIALCSDGKYLYLYIQHLTCGYIAKLGIGKNGTVLKQVYGITKIIQDSNINAMTQIIFHKGSLYILHVYPCETVRLKFLSIAKDKLTVLYMTEMCLSSKDRIAKSIFTDDDHFYIVLQDTDGKFSVGKIKLKAYNKEELELKVTLGAYALNDASNDDLFKEELALSSSFLNEIVAINKSNSILFAFKMRFNRRDRTVYCDELKKIEMNRPLISILGAYYVRQSNFLFLAYSGSSVPLVKYTIFQDIQISPHEINYMSKSLIHDLFLPYIPSTAKETTTPSLTSLLSSKLKGVPLASFDLYKAMLYNATSFILDCGNSSTFQFNTARDVMKYTFPASFAFEMSCTIFTRLFETIQKADLFNYERLCYLLLMKNYLHDLNSANISLIEYFTSFKLESTFFSFIELAEQLLTDMSKGNITSDDKINKLIYDELIEIIKIIISQKMTLNSARLITLFHSGANMETKLKLAEIIAMIATTENKSLDEFPEEIFKLMCGIERELLFNNDYLDNIHKHEYLSLSLKPAGLLKDYFLKRFTCELLSDTWMKEIDKESLAQNRILFLFIREATETCMILNEKLSEIFEGPNNRMEKFMGYIEANGFTFHMSLFLIQIFISNLKQFIEVHSKGGDYSLPLFPQVYLKNIINFFIILQEISESKYSSSLGIVYENPDILFQVESEHPFSSEGIFRVLPLQISPLKCHEMIEYDILSSVKGHSEVIVGFGKQLQQQHYSQNFPTRKNWYENEEVIQVSLANKNKNNDSSCGYKEFFDDYGFAMNVNLIEVQGNKNETWQRDVILLEIRRSIVHSIMMIVEGNITLSKKETHSEETELRDKLIFKSVFHSNLFRNIAMADSNCNENVASRGYIKAINTIAKQIPNEYTNANLIEVFCKYMDPTEDSSMKNIRKDSESDFIRTMLSNITNTEDILYYKGIKYLQKMLSLKNSYLANLGGVHIEPLVIHIFALILKFQNLVAMYNEKYISELYTLESQANNPQAMNDINLLLIKPEDVNKIEGFSLLLKIWTECSKIRIWFLEKKMMLAESIEKGSKDYSADFDTEISSLLSCLIDKARFFSNIICTSSNAEDTQFSQEIIDSILTCIKTDEINVEKISQKVMMQNKKGMQREIGMIILNLMLCLVKNETDLNGIIYEMNKIFKCGEKKIISLIDDLMGAENRILDRVKRQFHLLMENLVGKVMLIDEKGYSTMTQVSLMQSLIWKIKGRDYPVLRNLNIFEVFTQKLLANLQVRQELLEALNCDQDKIEYGKDVISKLSIRTAFSELFEIYALQIFSKIKSFKTAIETSTDDYHDSSSNINSVLTLRKSHSTLEEDDYKTILLLISNIFLQEFSHTKPSSTLKNYLLLFYKSMGFNHDTIHLIHTLSPKLLPTLLSLLLHDDMTFDIKFMVIKICYQYIKGIFSQKNYDENVLEFPMQAFVDMIKIRQDQKEILQSLEVDSSQTNGNSVLMNYFFWLIQRILNGENEKERYMLWEIVDLFKLFFDIPMLRATLHNVLNSKIKRLNCFKAILFILGGSVRSFHIGAKVLIDTEKETNTEAKYELLLEDSIDDVKSKITTSESKRYKTGRILGFSSSPSGNNPFELETAYEFARPAYLYEPIDPNKPVPTAYVILEEDITRSTIKNALFKISQESIKDLILNDDCSQESQTQGILDYVECNHIIPHIISNVLPDPHLREDVKFLSLKLLYAFLFNNGHLHLRDPILLHNLVHFLASFSQWKPKSEVKLFFSSLEYLENLLHKEILFNKRIFTVEESDQNELFEFFTYCFNENNQFVISSENEKMKFSVRSSVNNENNELVTLAAHNRSIHHLSLYNEIENLRILTCDSILFFESLNLFEKTPNEILQDLQTIISDSRVICGVSILSSKIKPDEEMQLFKLLKIPVAFVSSEDYYSLVSFLFFGENDGNKFRFVAEDIVSVVCGNTLERKVYQTVTVRTLKEEVKDSAAVPENSDGMFFFAEPILSVKKEKVNEENFVKSRNSMANAIRLYLQSFLSPMNKLISLISRRLLFKMLSEGYICEDTATSLFTETEVITLLRLFILEYYFNLLHPHCNLGQCKCKCNLKYFLSEFLLSLGTLAPKTVSNSIFLWILDLNFINQNESSTEKKQFLQSLENSTKTEEELLSMHELLEIKFQNIQFIMNKKLDDVDNHLIFKLLLSLFPKLGEMSSDSLLNSSIISQSISKIIHILYRKILNEEKGYMNIINFFKENTKVFPLNELNKMVSYIHLEKLMKDNVNEISDKVGVEQTNLLSFIFNYFDLIFLLFFKYHVVLDINYWLSSNHPIMNFYFIYQVCTKKFEWRSKDYLVFLTLIASKYELTLLFKENGTNKSNRDYIYQNFNYDMDSRIPFLRKFSYQDPASTTIMHAKKACKASDAFVGMYTKHETDIIFHDYFLQEEYLNEHILPSSDVYLSLPYSGFTTTLWAFGSNDFHSLACHGQLSREYGIPQRCMGIDDLWQIKSFQIGQHYPLALNYTGVAYSAGKGEGSGLKQTTAVKQFTADNYLNELPPNEGGIKNIYANNFNTTIIVTNANNLYGLGTNSCGNLSSAISLDKPSSLLSLILPLPSSSPVKTIAIGANNTIVILWDGAAYTLGDNSNCQTGCRTTRDNVTSWFQVPLPDKCNRFIHAAAGDNYFIMLIEDVEQKVRLYSMGNNEQGRCGVGDDQTNSLKKCTGVEEVEFKFISARNSSSAAITRTGVLYTWGSNDFGSLGLGDKARKAVKCPMTVDFFIERYFVDDVAICSNHMLVIAREKNERNCNFVRKVFSCGSNSRGTLGFQDRTMPNQCLPREIEFFTKNNLIPLRIACSMFQSYVITLNNNFEKTILECATCKMSAAALLQGYYFNIDTSIPNTVKFNCSKCFCTSSGYKIIAYVPAEKVQELNKLLPIDDILKQCSFVDTISCCECNGGIDYVNNEVNISTDNPSLVLCEKCFNSHSSLIEYPQVFYTFRGLKRVPCELPIQKLSHIIYGVEESSSYSMIISRVDQFSDSLYNFYNSDSISHFFLLMKKLNHKILLEYVNLRDEVIHTISDEKNLTYEVLLDHLIQLQDDARFQLIRPLLLDNGLESKIFYTILNNFLNLLNIEIFRLMSINEKCEEKSLFSNAIRENSAYISKANRMKNFYDRLNLVTQSYYGGNTVYVNRFKARKFYESNEVDLAGNKTIFGQIFTQIQSLECKRYLCKKGDRLFSAKLEGEGATDQGGPFRDVMHSACEELHSQYLNLFIKSPNNKAEIGSMRDKYILNPSANLEIHYRMYKLIGKLMAYAICSCNLLNLNIHPIIWKLMMENEIRFNEYETVDKMFYQFITDLEMTCKDIKSSDEFDTRYDLTFTIQNSSGEEKELIQSGKKTKVRFANWEKYIELAKKERVNEFENQIRMLKNGFKEILNDSFLQLLTWRELEDLVCGRPSINVKDLKSNTSYESCSESDMLIQWFWEVFSSFTDEERVLYVKYVWGRSRLPNPEIFSFQHSIYRSSISSPDSKLPQATTCYFSLKLPNYSSKKTLEEKLRYVIYNCNEIDADYQPDPIDY